MLVLSTVALGGDEGWQIGGEEVRIDRRRSTDRDVADAGGQRRCRRRRPEALTSPVVLGGRHGRGETEDMIGRLGFDRPEERWSGVDFGREKIAAEGRSDLVDLWKPALMRPGKAFGVFPGSVVAGRRKRTVSGGGARSLDGRPWTGADGRPWTGADGRPWTGADGRQGEARRGSDGLIGEEGEQPGRRRIGLRRCRGSRRALEWVWGRGTEAWLGWVRYKKWVWRWKRGSREQGIEIGLMGFVGLRWTWILGR